MINILIAFLIVSSAEENSKIINDALDLLTEITRTTTKEIEIEDLMSLWAHFITSAHKDVFIKWLFRKKENGRVVVNQAIT